MFSSFRHTVNCNPADARGNSKDGGNDPTSPPLQSRRRTMPTNGIKVALLVIKPRTSPWWLFSDASLEGDLRTQVQPQVAFFHKWAQNAFVHITWICKKQGAVPHWTAKAEVIALNAGIHARVCPLCVLGHCGPFVWSYESLSNPSSCWPLKPHTHRQRHDARMFGSIAYVTLSLPIKSGFAKLYALKNDDVVIKMTVKQHSSRCGM